MAYNKMPSPDNVMPGWARWAPQQSQHGYHMMVNAELQNFESPPSTLSSDTRSFLAPPQMPSSAGPSYIMAHGSFAPQSNYDTSRSSVCQPPMAFAYSHYQSHGATQISPPVKVEYDDRSPVRMLTPEELPRSQHYYGRDHYPYNYDSMHPQNLPPVIIPHPCAGSSSAQFDTSKVAIKEVSPIKPTNPSQEAVYHTSVDEVMRNIESLQKSSQKSSSKQLPTPAQSPKSDSPAVSSPKVEKPHKCERCSYTCSQLSHLKTHMEAHNGIRKFRCPICGSMHSQKGNLDNHIRAHNDQRDFRCPHPGCGKGFTSRGILNGHKKQHEPNRPKPPCHLKNHDNSICGKKFATPGNLKQHQIKYHAEELARLRAVTAACSSMNDLSPEDATLVKYLSQYHKNSNKGIKGRGKGNRVNKTPHRRVKTPPQIHQPDPATVYGIPSQRGIPESFARF